MNRVLGLFLGLGTYGHGCRLATPDAEHFRALRWRVFCAQFTDVGAAHAHRTMFTYIYIYNIVHIHTYVCMYVCMHASHACM